MRTKSAETEKDEPAPRRIPRDKTGMSVEERCRLIREAQTFEDWLDAITGSCPKSMSGDEVMRKIRDGEDW